MSDSDESDTSDSSDVEEEEDYEEQDDSDLEEEAGTIYESVDADDSEDESGSGSETDSINEKFEEEINSDGDTPVSISSLIPPPPVSTGINTGIVQPFIQPPMYPPIQPPIQPQVIPGIQPQVVPFIQAPIQAPIQPQVVPGVQPPFQPIFIPTIQPGIQPFILPDMVPTQPVYIHNVQMQPAIILELEPTNESIVPLQVNDYVIKKSGYNPNETRQFGLLPSQEAAYERLRRINRVWPISFDASDTGGGKTFIHTKEGLDNNLDEVVTAPEEAILYEKTVISDGIEETANSWEVVAGMAGTKLTKGFTLAGFHYRMKETETLEQAMAKKGNSVLVISNKVEKDWYFYPTPLLDGMVHKGTLFIFDEIKHFKNRNSQQSRAARFISRYVLEKSYDIGSRSRVSHLAAYPADNEESARALAELAGVLTKSKLYNWIPNPGLFEWRNWGLGEMYRWCRLVNPNCALQIARPFLNEMGSDNPNTNKIKSLAADFALNMVTKIILENLQIRAPRPMIKADRFSYDGFFNVEPEVRIKLNMLLAELDELIRMQKRGSQVKTATGDNSQGNILGKINQVLERINFLKVPTFERLARLILANVPGSKVTLVVDFISPKDELVRRLADLDPLVMDGTNKDYRPDIIANFQMPTTSHRLLIMTRVGQEGIHLHDGYGLLPRFILHNPSNNYLAHLQRRGRFYRPPSKSDVHEFMVYMKNEGMGVLDGQNINMNEMEVKVYERMGEKSKITQMFVRSPLDAALPGDLPVFIEDDTWTSGTILGGIDADEYKGLPIATGTVTGELHPTIPNFKMKYVTGYDRQALQGTNVDTNDICKMHPWDMVPIESLKKLPDPRIIQDVAAPPPNPLAKATAAPPLPIGSYRPPATQAVGTNLHLVPGFQSLSFQTMQIPPQLPITQAVQLPATQAVQQPLILPVNPVSTVVSLPDTLLQLSGVQSKNTIVRLPEVRLLQKPGKLEGIPSNMTKGF